jgi:hypothetical protein
MFCQELITQCIIKLSEICNLFHIRENDGELLYISVKLFCLNINSMANSVSIDMARTLLSSSTNCENAASTLEKSTKSANKAADKVIDKFAKLIGEN